MNKVEKKQYQPRIQVKIFDNVSGDNVTELNIFLSKMGESHVKRVTPLFNTILGGVIYVVEYDALI